MLSEFKEPVFYIRKSLEMYLRKWDVKSLVLGMSGGADSALCAVLARPVCDKLGIPLYGRSISIETNKAEEKERAKGLGQAICTDFLELDFTDEFTYLMQSKAGRDPVIMQNMTESKIRRGNIKAKMRMVELYDIAGATKGLVLSTDNLTELLLGFWTLHGDVGDFGMIQKLWKTEVFRMMEYLAETIADEKDYPLDPLKVDLDQVAYWLRETVKADPTDGLGITNTDLDQIMPNWTEKYKTCREAYEAVDQELYNFVLGGEKTKNDSLVIKRYKRAMVKRANPFNIPRGVILTGEGMTADINFDDKECLNG